MAFLVHIHVLRRNDPTSLTITPKTKLINWVYANFQTEGIYILGANGTNLCSIAQLYYSDRPLIDFSSPVTQRTCLTNKSAQESHAPLNSVFAVRQLHTEFLRAGADVMQTFTFYASEDKLANRGHTAGNIGVMFYK